METSQSYLRLRFDDDGDGTGKLLATVAAGGFSATGGAYFGIAEIEEFAKSIGRFPLSKDDEHLSIAGGFWSKERRGELEQEHLRITVYPVGTRGYIGIKVRIATEMWKGDRPDSQQSAAIELITTYEPISQFSADLIALVRNKAKEALLVGQRYR